PGARAGTARRGRWARARRPRRARSRLDLPALFGRGGGAGHGSGHRVGGRGRPPDGVDHRPRRARPRGGGAPGRGAAPRCRPAAGGRRERGGRVGEATWGTRGAWIARGAWLAGRIRCGRGGRGGPTGPPPARGRAARRGVRIEPLAHGRRIGRVPGAPDRAPRRAEEAVALAVRIGPGLAFVPPAGGPALTWRPSRPRPCSSGRSTTGTRAASCASTRSATGS